MNEMSAKKWWNEICGRESERTPEINLPRIRFVHHEIQIEWPRRELGTPAVGAYQVTTCAMEPPHKITVVILFLLDVAFH